MTNEDENELLTLLGDIESVLVNNNWNDVIFGSDTKWHKGRHTGFANKIEQWINRMGLLDVYDKFPVDSTHIHTDLKSVSTIDHFLVNERLMQFIVDCQPLQIGDD